MNSVEAQTTLTEEQKRRYAEDAYLVFANVLTEAELTTLREVSNALQDERRRVGGEERLAVIQDVVYKGDAFMQADRHPFLLAAVTDLISPDLQILHCKLNWKPPSIGKGEIDWHQDFPFFPHTNYDLLAVMFLLDDTTPENGCMRVIPGSHKLGPLPHDQDGTFVGKLTNLSAIQGREPVDLIVKAGGLTIHHDFDDANYRDHVYAYPTVDGVIDTVQWEGVREGVNDVRYLTTLPRAIDGAKSRRHAQDTVRAA